MYAAAGMLADLRVASAEEQQEHATAALDICIQHYLVAEDVMQLCASSRALQQLCSSRKRQRRQHKQKQQQQQQQQEQQLSATL
jgi:hypothetical protein